MSGLSLAAPMAINLAAAFIAILVGVRMRARRPPGDAGRATARFAAWWIGLGAFIVIGQATTLLGLTIVVPGAPAVLGFAWVAALAIALWGLVSYLAYLFTGRSRLFAVVTAAYVMQLLLGFAYVATLRPVAIVVTEWGSALEYAREAPPVAGLLFAAFFLLPPIFGALALGTLALRVRHRTTRYRAGAISIGILVWFGTSLVLNAAAAAGAGLTATTAVGGPALGTACMLLIVSAYIPPRWLRNWGVEPFGEGTVEPDHDREARRQERHRRMRELV